MPTNRRYLQTYVWRTGARYEVGSDSFWLGRAQLVVLLPCLPPLGQRPSHRSLHLFRLHIPPISLFTCLIQLQIHPVTFQAQQLMLHSPLPKRLVFLAAGEVASQVLLVPLIWPLPPTFTSPLQQPLAPVI